MFYFVKDCLKMVSRIENRIYSINMGSKKQVFGLAVNLLVEAPASHTIIAGFNTKLRLPNPTCCHCKPWESAGDSSFIWILATSIGDLD